LYFSMDETPFSFVEFDRTSYVPLTAAAANMKVGLRPEAAPRRP